MTDYITISVSHYVIAGLVLFITGLLGTVLSKNLFRILISLTIMFSGIIINFATFSAYNYSELHSGGIFALFIIILSTLQISVGIALSVNIHKFKNNVNTDEIGELRG